MAARQDRMKVNEVIIVEGKHDKTTLAQAVDATIITTGGFSLFRDKDLRVLLRRLADERGVIILTDPDSAGFIIRNRLRGYLPADRVKHAYIPPRQGKERRKVMAGKEGLLGVEGMDRETLRSILQNAGATQPQAGYRAVTKHDLYEWGLWGTPNSAKIRKDLQKTLDLPENLSSKALCEVLTMLGLYERVSAYIKNGTKKPDAPPDGGQV